jgi:hypothetical protein
MPGRRQRKDRMVNVAMGCSNEGWKMANEVWFNIESVEEGKMFFMNVALAEDEVEDTGEGEHMECISMEEEYKL